MRIHKCYCLLKNKQTFLQSVPVAIEKIINPFFYTKNEKFNADVTKVTRHKKRTRTKSIHRYAVREKKIIR